MLFPNDLLINLARNCPWLYDKTHKSCKYIIKRDNSWEEIARTLGADPSGADITADEASKRWGNLRDRYRKIRADLASTRLASGAGRTDADKRQVRWAHYPTLHALLHSHVAIRREGGDSFMFATDMESLDHIEQLDPNRTLTLDCDSQSTVFDLQSPSLASQTDVEQPISVAPAGPSGIQQPTNRQPPLPQHENSIRQQTGAGPSGTQPSAAGNGPECSPRGSSSAPRAKRRRVSGQNGSWQEDVVNIIKAGSE